jgi:hypothetical protein
MNKENDFFDCVTMSIENGRSYREARNDLRNKHSIKSLVTTEMFEEDRISSRRFTDWMVAYKNDFREAQEFIREHYRQLREATKQ